MTGLSARMDSLALSMGLISSLKRSEEATVPRRPLLFTTTLVPVIGLPLMPATKVLVCVPCTPMRMVLASPATPKAPMSILLSPVVRLRPALGSTAILFDPVVLLRNMKTKLSNITIVQLVKPKQAERYWKIVPATLKNLVTFETAAACCEMRTAKYRQKSSPTSY